MQQLISTFKDLTKIYILEEFCPGGTVLHMLNSPLSGHSNTLIPQDAAKIVGCVIHGLKCCHDHNILVRALAPENLLIGPKGIVKLSNFEFSKEILMGAFTMTVCGCHGTLNPYSNTCTVKILGTLTGSQFSILYSTILRIHVTRTNVWQWTNVGLRSVGVGVFDLRIVGGENTVCCGFHDGIKQQCFGWCE